MRLAGPKGTLLAGVPAETPGPALKLALSAAQLDEPELPTQARLPWRLWYRILAEGGRRLQRGFLSEEVAERLIRVELPGIKELISG